MAHLTKSTTVPQALNTYIHIAKAVLSVSSIFPSAFKFSKNFPVIEDEFLLWLVMCLVCASAYCC